MLSYLAGVCSSSLSIIFIIFIIGALGFMLGGVNVKGISLGTAGVLIVALAYGVLIHYFPTFSIVDTQITLWGDSIKSKFALVSNIGTALFVTAVGLIAGPKFFRAFNRKSLAYLLLGVIIIVLGAVTAIICILCDENLSSEMAVGLLTGRAHELDGAAGEIHICRQHVAVFRAADTVGSGRAVHQQVVAIGRHGLVHAHAGGAVALRVAVDEEHAPPALFERAGQVHARRRLADPAFLVGDGNDFAHGLPP